MTEVTRYLSYSAGHANWTILVLALTIIYVKFYAHHCVQNSKLCLKMHFGIFSHDFLRVANFFGRNFGYLIPDLGRSEELAVITLTGLQPFHSQNVCYTINTTSIILLSYLHRRWPHQNAQVTLVNPCNM